MSLSGLIAVRDVRSFLAGDFLADTLVVEDAALTLTLGELGFDEREEGVFLEAAFFKAEGGFFALSLTLAFDAALDALPPDLGIAVFALGVSVFLVIPLKICEPTYGL